MRRLFSVFFLLTILVPAAELAMADGASAQFAMPTWRVPDEPDVSGFRFSFLHGDNGRMGGLDLGFLSMSESDVLSGAAFVLGLHKLDSDMDGGAAFSLVNFHKGRDAGLNAAFVNMVNDVEDGVNFGFINLADGNTLADIGGLNVAVDSTVQLGFVNVAQRIEGVQLGFINIAENGFLRVFPFFNFPKGDQ